MLILLVICLCLFWNVSKIYFNNLYNQFRPHLLNAVQARNIRDCCVMQSKHNIFWQIVYCRCICLLQRFTDSNLNSLHLTSNICMQSVTLNIERGFQRGYPTLNGKVPYPTFKGIHVGVHAIEMPRETKAGIRWLCSRSEESAAMFVFGWSTPKSHDHGLRRGHLTFEELSYKNCRRVLYYVPCQIYMYSISIQLWPTCTCINTLIKYTELISRNNKYIRYFFCNYPRGNYPIENP